MTVTPSLSVSRIVGIDIVPSRAAVWSTIRHSVRSQKRHRLGRRGNSMYAKGSEFSVRDTVCTIADEHLSTFVNSPQGCQRTIHHFQMPQNLP